MDLETKQPAHTLADDRDLVKETDSAISQSSALQDLQEEARAVFQKTVSEQLGVPYYSSVAVLPVHWAKYLDEELNCAKEVKELGDLLQKQFRFKCDDTLLLDDKSKPQLQLNAGIANFIRDNDGDCRTHLLILYYTGHGYDSEAEGLYITAGHSSGSISTSNIGPQYPAEAKWKPVEDAFADADADVLIILDTCSAGSAFKGSTAKGSVFEVLAAVGKNGLTPAPGRNSFSRALIDSLTRHSKDSKHIPLSTFDLNQNILRERGDHSSHLLPRAGQTRRFVQLMPLQGKPTHVMPRLPPASFNLTLQFEFGKDANLGKDQVDASPTKAEVKALASALSSSVGSELRQHCGLIPRAIRWVDLQRTLRVDGSADAALLRDKVTEMQYRWRYATKKAVRQERDKKRTRPEEDDKTRSPPKQQRTGDPATESQVNLGVEGGAVYPSPRPDDSEP